MLVLLIVGFCLLAVRCCWLCGVGCVLLLLVVFGGSLVLVVGCSLGVVACCLLFAVCC